MHKIENKNLWKENMSYGDETWYMGRVYEELKITLALEIKFSVLDSLDHGLQHISL